MNTDAILTVVLAGVIFLILWGFYKVIFEKQVRAQENIHRLLQDPKSDAGQNLIRRDDAVLRQRVKDENSAQFRLEVKLDRANLMIRPHEFKIICAVTAGLGVLVAQFLLGLPMMLAILFGGPAGFFTPHLYLNMRIWLRMNKAAAQFADVLDALVNCFKTGYGFNRAVQVIADNFDDPWGTEFGKMSVEMNLGANQEDALAALSRRVPSPDMDLFVTALMIQKETGGNMAELLSNLSKTCRERFKLLRKVSAISAQGKLSAGIIICVPFLLMGMMFLFLPGPVMAFVTNPIGIILLVVAGIWMLCGVGVLFKIVSLEV